MQVKGDFNSQLSLDFRLTITSEFVHLLIESQVLISKQNQLLITKAKIIFD